MPGFMLSVKKRRWLSATTFELTFARPTDLDYLPGQRIRLSYRSIERDYSLLSSPADPEITICVQRVTGGGLSPLLADLAPGQTVSARGPFGYFLWHPAARPAVCVATGTGIAPFVAFVRSGARPHLLLHGARSFAELHYRETLATAAGTYMPCLSGPERADDEKTEIFKGYVTAYLSRHLPSGSYDFYLCGRGDMIREATLLADRRFPGSHVFTEIFY